MVDGSTGSSLQWRRVCTYFDPALVVALLALLGLLALVGLLALFGLLALLGGVAFRHGKFQDQVARHTWGGGA